MVSTTTLYRGDPIQHWPEGPQYDFTQHMAHEPAQTTFWSSQGTFDYGQQQGQPFTGGSRITSGFWSHESFRFPPRWNLGPHGGIDMIPIVPGNNLLHVICPGIVVGNEWSEGTGNITTLELQDTVPRVYQNYAHLESLPELEIGQFMQRGDPLANMGDTGTYATGAHLHLTTYTTLSPDHSWDRPGTRLYLDPLPYLGSMFQPQPGPGVTLTLFQGGLINLLDVEGQQQNLSSVSITEAGEFIIYVPGSPPFVNRAFVDHFEDGWIHAGTPLLAAERSS